MIDRLLHLSRRLPKMACIIALGTVLVRNAQANGRFPAANQLVVDQEDPNHIFVRTTFGLLHTRNGGKTWDWICDTVVGFGDYDDPAIGIGKNGILLAGLSRGGVATSIDNGCSWSAETPAMRLPVPDLAIDPNDASKAIAVVSGSTADDAGKLSYGSVLVGTVDGGKNWLPIGDPLPSDLLANTLQMAPSKPARIYVSGRSMSLLKGVILRSDDGGRSWETLDGPADAWSSPWISAVDPQEPNRLFVRLGDEQSHRLFLSNDGATSWREIYTGAGALLGFALSPDGKRVAVGGKFDGVQIAQVGEYIFTQTSSIQTQCLTWTKVGLFACGRVPDPFSVGLSLDEGRTFRVLDDLEQFCPAVCPADGVFAARCPDRWNRIQTDLWGRPAFACPNLPADWIVRPDFPGGNVSTGDAGAQPDAGVRADAGTHMPAASGERGGCSSCTVSRPARRDLMPDDWASLLLPLALGLLSARRTRESRRRKMAVP